MPFPRYPYIYLPRPAKTFFQAPLSNELGTFGKSKASIGTQVQVKNVKILHLVQEYLAHKKTHPHRTLQ